jgi:hypothetical protein
MRNNNEPFDNMLLSYAAFLCAYHLCSVSCPNPEKKSFHRVTDYELLMKRLRNVQQNSNSI